MSEMRCPRCGDSQVGDNPFVYQCDNKLESLGVKCQKCGAWVRSFERMLGNKNNLQDMREDIANKLKGKITFDPEKDLTHAWDGLCKIEVSCAMADPEVKEACKLLREALTKLEI